MNKTEAGKGMLIPDRPQQRYRGDTGGRSRTDITFGTSFCIRHVCHFHEICIKPLLLRPVSKIVSNLVAIWLHQLL